MFQLHYFFDAGSGICLWAANNLARKKFGYPIDLRALSLTQETIVRGQALIGRYDTSIDSENPAGPSPWSSAEDELFRRDSNEFLSLLRDSLGSDFDVLDRTR